MKNFLILLITFLIFGSNIASASDVKNPLKFAGGVITAYALHEGGHQAMAWLTGTDMSWEWGNYNQLVSFNENTNDNWKGTLINASGITTQLIVSEYILRSDNVDKDSYYTKGILFWNFFNPIFYAVDYWFIKDKNFNDKNGSYRGDLQGIEYYSSKETADIFAIASVLIAGYQGYRYINRNKYKHKNNLNLNFVPVKNGGMFVINFKF